MVREKNVFLQHGKKAPFILDADFHDRIIVMQQVPEIIEEFG